MNYGFVKVGTAIPLLKVADCKFNTEQMLPIIEEAENSKVEILLFPELGITSYSCGDLFQQQSLLEEAENALKSLLDNTKNHEMIIIVGLPIIIDGRLLNCAAILQRGEIKGIVPKTFIPDYHEFSEKRWFSSSDKLPEGTKIWLCGQEIRPNARQLFRTDRCVFGVEICEDLWAPNPPSTALALRGAEIIFNLSASNELAGKNQYLKQICKMQSARNICGYVYSGCGYGESSGDVVFAGNAYIIENGNMLNESKRFSLKSQLVISEIDIEKLRRERIVDTTFSDARREYADIRITDTYIKQNSSSIIKLTRKYDKNPFIPNKENFSERCNEIFNIQALGLAKRIEHTNARSCVIGISGGLDSTLALLATVKAFDILNKERKNIIAVTMPGFGTTDRTYNNALDLMSGLSVTIREISIKEACVQHFSDIGHDINEHDVTYENSQARERTQILMDIANKYNGLVIGTGDLSELALGWATYNGDHMSMYGINASIPKTLIRHLVNWVADNCDNMQTRTTLLDIINTPISPELIPADKNGNIKQKTEDLVGPYELHDFFLYHILRGGYKPSKIFFIARNAFENIYDDATIKKWLTTFYRRFFAQQFKRSCMPDGPKVGSCSLSPRGDWRMPSDANSTIWLEECKTL